MLPSSECLQAWFVVDALIRGAIAFLVAWSSLASIADAQAVNPRYVSFYPSADHNLTDDNGRAVVTSYGLQFHERGRAQPFLILDLGKPEPGPDGRIEVEFRGLIAGPLMPGIPLEARVVAFGPGGRAESDPSNPFVFELENIAARVNIAPSVRIATPPNGATFARSPRLPITVTANDPDGHVVWVAVYIDDRMIGSSARSPYTVWWRNVTAGAHTVWATAADDAGATAASPSIRISVAAGRKPAPAAKRPPPAKPRIVK